MVIRFSFSLQLSLDGLSVDAGDLSFRMKFPKWLKGDPLDIVILDSGDRATEIKWPTMRILTTEAKWKNNEPPREYYIHPTHFVVQNRYRPWTKTRERAVTLYRVMRINDQPILADIVGTGFSRDTKNDRFVGQELIRDYERKTFGVDVLQ